MIGEDVGFALPFISARCQFNARSSKGPASKSDLPAYRVHHGAAGDGESFLRPRNITGAFSVGGPSLRSLGSRSDLCLGFSGPARGICPQISQRSAF